jgi:hypothetical protein
VYDARRVIYTLFFICGWVSENDRQILKDGVNKWCVFQELVCSFTNFIRFFLLSSKKQLLISKSIFKRLAKSFTKVKYDYFVRKITSNKIFIFFPLYFSRYTFWITHYLRMFVTALLHQT